MGDFEVCSNGAAEVSAQTAAPAVASPAHAIQSEAGSSPEQAASDTEEGTGGRDSCSTDDDQFSDVGEAADTEVMTDHRQHLQRWLAQRPSTDSLYSCSSSTLMHCVIFSKLCTT